MTDRQTQDNEIIRQNPTPQLVASCPRSIHHPRYHRHRWVSLRIQEAFTYALAVPIARTREHQPICLLPPVLLVSHYIHNLSTELVISVIKGRPIDHDIPASFNPYL